MESFASMKRKDLQRLAKKHGLRANAKVLIKYHFVVCYCHIFIIFLYHWCTLEHGFIILFSE